MQRAPRLVLLSLVAVLLFAAGLAAACHFYFLKVTITAPVQGQQLTGDPVITVTGTVATPGWRPQVTVRVNGGSPVYASVYRGSFRARVTLADGDNRIEATVRDGPFVGSTSVRVTYGHPTQDPFEVAVTSPTAGQSLTGSRTLAVRGTVSGRAGAAVAVTLNGGAPVAATISGGAFSASVELVDGDNVIVATATAGAESVSATVRVIYEPLPPPTVAIEWPAEGQYVFGSRALTVRGAVARASSPSVLVAVNGGTPVAATVAADGAFSAQIQLDDGANTLVASVLAPEGAAAATAHVVYPFVSLDTFQGAERVVGRAGPGAGAESCASSTALPTAGDVCTPFGSAAWDGANLFVSDWPRSRVLAFEGMPGEDGAAAAFTVGQPDFTGYDASSEPGRLSGPETVRIVGGKLFVAEYGNNRLLIFDPIPTGFGAEAVVAVGAPSVSAAGNGSCTADGLLRPESFVVAGDRLIVADPGHNRVLVWNEIPTASGTPADLVLGQPDFTTCEANAGGVSARSLQWPTDVWSDGVRLFVADAMNNRVLGWSVFPETSDAPADLVLGQSSFTSTRAAASQGGLQFPYFLDSNGNQLFVADQWNNRVLVWNALPTASGALADVVLGQASFDAVAANDEDGDGTPDAAPSGRTLAWPAGVTVTEDAVIVTDQGNSRYLVFRGR